MIAKFPGYQEIYFLCNPKLKLINWDNDSYNQ